MKKILFIAAFALAAVFSACQVKENVETPSAAPRMIEVKAVMDEGELPTRTILPDGTTHFFWSEEDKIAAWDGTTPTTDIEISSIDENGTATFVIPENTQWVIYPSRAMTVEEKGYDQDKLTWSRSYNHHLSEEGSELIPDGANPMYAIREGNVLKFKNLCGYIQFQLTGSKTLSKLHFKVNNMNSPAISGKAVPVVNGNTMTLEYPILSEVPTSGVYKHGYITVSGRDIPLGSSPVSVYVVVPPATYKDSELVLEFTDGTSAAVLSTNDIVVERNTVRKIKPIDTDALFPAAPEALDANGQSNCYMVIAGSEAKHYSFTAQKCVSGETFDLAKDASLLWSESNTLIRSMTYDSNTHVVTFQYGGGNEEGNAIISLDQGLLGTAATLLWNYHIWVTDQPEDILMDETDMPGPVLDRNVGATWAPKSEDEITNMTQEQWLETIGTYYQYGNHIPYPRLKAIENSTTAWNNCRVAVMYGFSNYCHRFAHSASIKETLAEQEQFPNYAYHKGTKTTYVVEGKTTGSESMWTQVVLKGGPVGTDADGNDEGENIWYVSNVNTEKTSDYDPCPQGYCFITATYTYQETVNNDVTDHLLGGYFAGKWNTDVSGHIMYFPAAGYIGNGKRDLVGGVSDNRGRVVYWSYYGSTTTNMAHVFRRNFMNQAQKKFAYDNQPFSSQAHNMRCRLLVTE